MHCIIVAAVNVSCLGHGICLVQNKQLEGRAGVAGNGLPHRSRRERLDLFPHNIDAALVTGIQFLNPCLG